jgi:hypothetical protein
MMNMDAYFGGAEMQAMAQLIHISEVRTWDYWCLGLWTSSGTPYSLDVLTACLLLHHRSCVKACQRQRRAS